VRGKKIGCLLLTGIIFITGSACGKTDPIMENKTTTMKEKLIEGTVDLASSDQLYFEDGLTITGLNFTYSKDITTKNDTYFFPAIQAMTGVDFDILWVNADDYLSSLSTTLLAGLDQLPDILNASSFGVMDLADDGAVVPLDDYLDLMPHIVEAVGEERMDYWRESDGHIYTIPSIINVPGAQTMMVRQDWLDKLGLSEPTTWEEWLTLWRAIRDNDLNGNGDPTDEIPFASQFENEGELCLLPLLNAFGIKASSDTQFCVLDDGTYTMVYEHPKYAEFLKAMQELYTEGLLSADFDSQTLEVVDRQMDTNLLGTTFNWAERCRTSAETLRQAGAKDALWKAVEPITGPDGTQMTPERKMVAPVWCITSAAANHGKMEDIVRFFDWYYSQEGSYLYSYGLPGISYEIVNGDPVMDKELTQNGFTDYRAAGCNNSDFGGLWQEEAFTQCLFESRSESEMDELTEEFYKGIRVINTPYFYTMPKTYQTSSYVTYHTTLITEGVCKLRDRTIKGELSVDEFFDEYEKLKQQGLQEILDSVTAIAHGI